MRYAVRTLRASPGLAIVAIVSLAIGTGATTAVFSLVDAVHLRAVEFSDPGTLVDIHEESATRLCAGCGVGTSVEGFHDWRESARSFSMMAAHGGREFVIGGGDAPELVSGALVTANLFELLDVTPAIGRTFRPEEDRAGGERVVVLNDALWQRHFGGARSVIGETIRLNGEPYTVIGIMPPGFGYPGADLWVAFETHATGGREDRDYGVIARLAAGVPIERADAEMKSIAARLEEAYPATQQEWSAGVVPLSQDMASDVGPYFWVLQAVVALVLIIACTNLAGLMIARAASRQSELAVRAANGATRWRLARLLLTESLLLAAIGGAAGLVLARWSIDLIATRLAGLVPWYVTVELNARVVAFCAVTVILTGLAFGILPAVRASRPDVHSTLKSGSTQAIGGGVTSRTRAVLVAAQLGFALVLLTAAGLMIRTYLRLSARPSGYDSPERVLVSQLVTLDRRFDDPAQVRATVDQLLDRVGRLPGARAAVSATVFFAGFGGSDRRITVEGMPAVPDGASPRFYSAVTPGFFEVQGRRVIAGRGITAGDGPGSPPVVVINAAMARRLRGEGQAIGMRLRFGDDDGAPWLTVVGVVDDGETGATSPQSWAWVPFAQQPGRALQLMVRTESDPLQLVPSIRAEIASAGGDVPIRDIRTLAADAARSWAHIRVYAAAFTACGAFAVLLAAIGIWGIVAWSVGQRTREIGIRMALGASAREVLGLFSAEGMRLAAIGLLLGGLVSAAVTRVLRSLLYGTSPLDAWAFGLAILVFVAVTLLATVVPARRATRVDPMAALRAD